MAVLLAAPGAIAQVPALSDAPLKTIFGDKFQVSVAVNDDQAKNIDKDGAAVIRHHFNSIVPENVLKCSMIHPEKDRYFWDDADAYVKFGEENGMTIIGHCLVWHYFLPEWFARDDKGNYVSADELKSRMRDHIHTTVGRYKGRIKGWDVVNEAISADGRYCNTPYYEILGEEYIPLAFQYAHEADPNAELYINDFGMNEPGRRDAYVRIINDLKRRGLRVDGIGMQGHMGMDYPDLDDYERSIEAFAATGCKVMITEWDMTALPSLTNTATIDMKVDDNIAINPYVNGLDEDVDKHWNSRMDAFFSMFLRHADAIDRVTVWGLSDGTSWRNDWPVTGRTDYPVYFDRNLRMKPFLKKLSDYHKTKK